MNDTDTRIADHALKSGQMVLQPSQQQQAGAGYRPVNMIPAIKLDDAVSKEVFRDVIGKKVRAFKPYILDEYSSLVCTTGNDAYFKAKSWIKLYDENAYGAYYYAKRYEHMYSAAGFVNPHEVRCVLQKALDLHAAAVAVDGVRFTRNGWSLRPSPTKPTWAWHLWQDGEDEPTLFPPTKLSASAYHAIVDAYERGSLAGLQRGRAEASAQLSRVAEANKLPA